MRRWLLGGAVLFGLGGVAMAASSARPTRRRAFNPSGVAAIGDSLTASGAYLREVHSQLGTSGRAIGLSGQGAAVIAGQLRYVIADGVDVVVIQAGVNDLASGRPVAHITGELAAMYRQAKAAGVRVVAVPIMPWGAYQRSARFRARAAELQRDTAAVNAWIRSAGVATVDVAELGDGTDLRTDYDSGDGLHLSAAGQRRLGQLIATTINRL